MISKSQAYSVNMIETAFLYMEEKLEKELIRENQRRRKDINNGFKALRLHFDRLKIDICNIDGRGVFYNPEQNLEYFNQLRAAFNEFKEKEG